MFEQLHQSYNESKPDDEYKTALKDFAFILINKRIKCITVVDHCRIKFKCSLNVAMTTMISRTLSRAYGREFCP